MTDDVHQEGLSRRELIEGAAAGAALAAGGGAFLATAGSARASGSKEGFDLCDGSRDIQLVNGKFIDYRGQVASGLTIKDGRIVDLKGKSVGQCTLKINLKGRTVIPGMIDAHVHFTRTGTNVGYETRWIETAFSFAELFEVIAERAKTVPPGPPPEGGIITAQGGWTPLQFAEARLPTLAELDVAAPNHAVYLQGRTNSIGKAFFEANGIAVDPVTGQVSSTGAVTTLLRSIQTFEDKVRGTQDVMDFAVANGLTSCHDVSNLTIQPDDYAVQNALYHRRGRHLDVRMRHYQYMPDATPEELATYMHPIFREAGDGAYRINGVGEQISNSLAALEENLRQVARHQWRMQQHFGSPGNGSQQAAAFVTVGTEFDITDLRWSWGHAGVVTEEEMQAVKSVGMGVTLTRGPARAWIDSGIHAGGATDATNVSWLSPWFQIYFFVTRRNQQGNLVLDGQQISRLEALGLYTIGSAYFSREEDELGSFEGGKLADLAVLSDDFLTVPDEQLRKMRSNLTLQGGRIVHADGPFAKLAPDKTQPYPDRYPESVEV
jgi:hypothetical protein